MTDEDRKRLVRILDQINNIFDSLKYCLPEEEKPVVTRQIKNLQMLTLEFENETEHDPYG